MFNVCPACGSYHVEKEIRAGDGLNAWAVCPGCGHAHPFLRLPLFVITGASGAGKTALALEMPSRDTTCIHLETDILWRSEFNDPENDYRAYRDMWLRLAKNIGQSGRPVVLYGSVTPSQFEACPERRYFSQVHTLALVCDPSVLAARLRARPAWREAGSGPFLEAMLRFNAWFSENAESASPPITLLDTTRANLSETTAGVVRWVRERWNPNV